MKRIVALALVAVLMVACGATPKIKVNGETAKVVFIKLCQKYISTRLSD